MVESSLRALEVTAIRATRIGGTWTVQVIASGVAYQRTSGTWLSAAHLAIDAAERDDRAARRRTETT